MEEGRKGLLGPPRPGADQTALEAPASLVGVFFATFLASFLGSFLYTFLEEFWRQNGFKNGFKMAPTSAIFWAQILYRFFCVLGALWVPLGSLLGPPKALLGGLWTPKTSKNPRFFEVFAKASFLSS